MRPMFESMTQHVDRAPLADLALQPRQELARRWPVLTEVKCLNDVRLRLPQEGRKLHEVHAVLAVVILGPPADPAGALYGRRLVNLIVRCSARLAGRTGQRRANQPLEAALAGVGRHVTTFGLIDRISTEDSSDSA